MKSSCVHKGASTSSAGKESASNERDLGLILGLGRSPGGGHGNSLQYSCLENLHGERSLAGYSPWGHRESDTTDQLSTAHTHRSHSVMPDSLPPHGCSSPGSSLHGDSPGKNTGVGCQALFQEIFPTQRSNLILLHCRQLLYQLNSL